MRRLISIICAFSAAWTLSSCASSRPAIRQIEERDFGRPFSPEELNDDLTCMLKTADDVHVNLYSTVDKPTFEHEVQRVRALLGHPMNRFEYFETVAPLLALPGDGHTAVLPPDEEYQHFRDNGGKVFPFLVAREPSRGVTVESSLDSAVMLPPGTTILTINNLPADSLFTVFKQYHGCERDAYNDLITSTYFRKYLWLNNITAPYIITYRLANERTPATLRSEGAGLQQNQMTRGKPYEYERLSGGIGLLTYRVMTNNAPETFDDFLERVFGDLRASHVAGLIIDLRENGGGNSDFAEVLLQYITDKPFRICSRMYRKASDEYRAQMRGNIPFVFRWGTYPPMVWLGALCADELKVFTVGEGELVEHNFPVKLHTPDALRFTGKVCFLTGTATFSSAVDLADGVKTYGLGTIIGEETGGVPTSYGDRYLFTLPNTNLEVSVSSAHYIRANEDPDSRRGVLPDIEVKQPAGVSKTTRDSVLERAKIWILRPSDMPPGKPDNAKLDLPTEKTE